MKERKWMTRYFALGSNVASLVYCKGRKTEYVVGVMRRLLDSLKDEPKYEKALDRIKGILERIEIDLFTEDVKESDPLPTKYSTEIPPAATKLTEEILRENKGVELVQVYAHSTIDKVKKHLATLKNESQRIMAQETISCLETGAHRAATVMAWSLTFDHFRRWMFSAQQRLGDFNAVLTSRNKSATKKYDPIQKYDEFEEHSESFIIEVAYAANLLTKTQNKVLGNALSDRNHFAHPSSRLSTETSAMGYVDGLVENILTSTAFKYRQSKG